jgi:hypothetical protein
MIIFFLFRFFYFNFVKLVAGDVLFNLPPLLFASKMYFFNYKIDIVFGRQGFYKKTINLKLKLNFQARI